MPPMYPQANPAEAPTRVRRERELYAHALSLDILDLVAERVLDAIDALPEGTEDATCAAPPASACPPSKSVRRAPPREMRPLPSAFPRRGLRLVGV